MGKTPEAKLTDKMIEKLNNIEGCYVEKLHASVYGKPKLDVFGAIDGKMLYIEVKTPGNMPTKRQQSTIRLWNKKANVATTWVDNVDDAINFAQSVRDGSYCPVTQ